MRLLSCGELTVRSSGAPMWIQVWVVNGELWCWDGTNWYAREAFLPGQPQAPGKLAPGEGGWYG